MNLLSIFESSMELFGLAEPPTLPFIIVMPAGWLFGMLMAFWDSWEQNWNTANGGAICG
jgi:hypothetical protein